MKKIANFEEAFSDTVVKVSDASPAAFLRPSDNFVSGPKDGELPEELAFDDEGYLFPDPTEIVSAMRRGESKARKPLNGSRQSAVIISSVLEHQHARGMKGATDEERYLIMEGKGGLGKSYSIEWLFAKMGVPCLIEVVPSDAEQALEVLFGNPRSLNENRGNLVETARQVYLGRGITNPSTKTWLREGPNAAAKLYMALHPDGWAKTNPVAYNQFWKTLAEKEGITADRDFVPKLGLFERAHRNGMVLFLDEMNRIPDKVRERCMRALEDDKDLEVYGGRVLSARNKTGFIIGAMNGSRSGYSTKPLDQAQRRRAKVVTIPDMDIDDTVGLLKFMISGQPELNPAIVVTGAENAKFGGSICDKSFIELVEKGDPQKIDALKALADMHMYMDAQICEVGLNKGWMKGETRNLTETLPSGPTLLKSFVTRTVQLIGNEDNQSLTDAIVKVSRAFEETYIQPLVDAGISRDKLAQQVCFGKFGDPSAPKKLDDEEMSHFASLFAPVTTKDVQRVNGGTADLKFQEGGIYPVISKAGEKAVGICSMVGSVMKISPAPSFAYPLDPERGQSELSLEFSKGLDITPIDWSEIQGH